MASPGFVVSGKGNPDSLDSASHGAGRAMSRKAANEKFNWKDVNRFLKQQGVTLISAGLDEVPMAYKNIREVMAAQKDLVTILGQFDPKLVKMAPSGERPSHRANDLQSGLSSSVALTHATLPTRFSLIDTPARNSDRSVEDRLQTRRERRRSLV